MGGAYVAKPAVVSTPSVPPGWDPDWPPPGETGPFPDPGGPEIDPDPFFPAPFPPGYETDYSIVATATASIAPTSTTAATSSLRDHDNYATNEPSSIVWTATIDGVAVDLKLIDGSFASSFSEDSVFGTFWGTTPLIIFDIDDTNDGDTIVLQVNSTLLNSDNQIEVLFDTVNISVNVDAPISTPSNGEFHFFASLNWTHVLPNRVFDLRIEAGSGHARVRHRTDNGFFKVNALPAPSGATLIANQPMGINIGTSSLPAPESSYVMKIENGVTSNGSIETFPSLRVLDQEGNTYDTRTGIVVLGVGESVTWATIS